MPTLKVGAARRDITPDYPVEMRGTFSRRPAESANDPLYAKALWFDDGAERAALVTCDIITAERDMTEKCRAALADRLGLEPRQFIIVGTHTHTAPRVEPPFTDECVPKVVEAVAAAADDARPSEVKTARAIVHGISFNRRGLLLDGTGKMNPGRRSQSFALLDGPVDPMLGLFVFESEGRDPIVLANFALHCCTAGPGRLSADFPAAFEQVMRETTGKDLVVQFTQGPCGNVNHTDMSKRGEDQRSGMERWRVGCALAEAALWAMPDAQPIDAAPVRTVSRKRTFKCRDYSPEDAEAVKQYDQYDSSTWGGDMLAATRLGRVRRCIEWGGERELEVQALRFGEAGLAFMPGEVYAEFGIRIKKESALYPHTYPVELSGADISYVPVKETFPRGGYTVIASRFEAGIGEALTDEALAALAEAAD